LLSNNLSHVLRNILLARDHGLQIIPINSYFYPTHQFITMLKNVFSILALAVSQISFAQNSNETLLLRNPSISQNHISFVYGGDIWIADKSGQNARRLTVN